MFYQEALPKFQFLSRVDSLLTIGDRHRRTVAATFEKAESANSLPFARNGCPFVWGVYFCMGAYKRDVVVVIKMGAYIYEVLILCGCLLSRFTGFVNFPFLVATSILSSRCLMTTNCGQIQSPCMEYKNEFANT